MTFVNSLDPDQARRFVGPDLDPNCLTLIAFLKDFLEKLILKKSSDDNKSKRNYPRAFKELGYLKKEATLSNSE